jgi:hypothetical protein
MLITIYITCRKETKHLSFRFAEEYDIFLSRLKRENY